MTSKERVLSREKQRGRDAAINLQGRAPDMTGTELNAEDSNIPHFTESVKVKNMLDRPLGFVCISTAGRVVRLLQKYDSNVFTAEPEELPAQWGFAWSTDPAKALPYISLSTSPYNIGDCCLNEAGEPMRSTIDNNVWSPEAYPAGWESAI